MQNQDARTVRGLSIASVILAGIGVALWGIIALGVLVGGGLFGLFGFAAVASFVTGGVVSTVLFVITAAFLSRMRQSPDYLNATVSAPCSSQPPLIDGSPNTATPESPQPNDASRPQH